MVPLPTSSVSNRRGQVIELSEYWYISTSADSFPQPRTDARLHLHASTAISLLGGAPTDTGSGGATFWSQLGPKFSGQNYHTHALNKNWSEK
jgi:hypothetical protein